MLRFKNIIVVFVAIYFSSNTFSAEARLTDSESHRTSHRTGLILGLNDPVPAVFGISLAYNILDFFRITAGVGRFNSDYQYNGYTLKTKSVTYGGGIRFLVPGWNLSPVGGLSWATIATEGFPNNDHHIYAVVGLEWQAKLGFNLSAGYERSFDNKIGGLPYLTIGWFLPIL